MITLLGKNSQLGMSLTNQSEFHIDGISSKDLDLRNADNIDKVLEKYDNKILINCSAFNDVEEAETNDDAFLINHIAVEKIAKYCSKSKIFFIHISSDFVFDGKKGHYTEFDKTNPINAYGRSKVGGEQSIQEFCNNFVIIRTSWLYSHYPTKNNFLHKIKNLLHQEKSHLYGARDIYGSPTSANALARGILSMLEYLEDSSKFNQIYHFSDRGRVSRFHYLCEISNLIYKRFKISKSVQEVDNEFFKLSAPRPIDTSLDSSLFCQNFSYNHKDWKTSLNETVSLL